MAEGANIFFLYDPKDKVFFEAIRKHLGRAVRKMNTFRTPESPAPGADVKAEWRKYLDQADLVILLASADYWNSDICEAIHDEAMERFDRQHLPVAPVLVRDHLWRDELTDIQVLPKDEKPINLFSEEKQDSILKDIALEIRALIKRAGARESFQSQIELLAQSFLLFNYQEQKESVYHYYHQMGDRFNPLNIFLVQGTERCGHRLLIDIVRKEYQIGLESPPIPIPLDLIGRTVDALWYELRNALVLSDLNPYDKEGIAGRILARLEHEHIILLFDHIERCHRQEILPLINGFWQELNGYLDRLNPARTPHRFFLFINDRACGQFEYELPQFYPDTGEMASKQIVQLLPSIKRIRRHDVDVWLSKIFDAGLDYRQLWSALKDKSDTIVEAPEGHYVKDAVLRIIDQLPVKDKKAELLARLNL